MWRIPKANRPARRWAPILVALVTVVLGCGQRASGGAEPEAGAEASTPQAAAPASTGRTYQRTLVFMDTSHDTTMFAPWDFENRSEPGGVARSVRGWLGRGGQWAQFMEDEWFTSPSRVPWRILPRGPVRLIVDTEDVLRTVVYREGLRDLAVRIGPLLVEWRGQRGEIYRLSSGTARLSETRTEGLVLDVSTARLTGEPEPAEWALLTDGGDLTLLLVDPEGPGDYRAWARRGEEDLGWPDVTVDWAETRSFERARRTVPVLWAFRSGEGELSGTFEAVSSHFQALDGEGVILPALGVYEVAGTLTIGEEESEVRGFLRHVQR